MKQKFLVQNESCECNCGLFNCNSKQKWNHDKCRCECDWSSSKDYYMWNPECNKACKSDEY